MALNLSTVVEPGVNVEAPRPALSGWSVEALEEPPAPAMDRAMEAFIS